MGASTTPKFTNRLAQETSPYLLQHAHNPVDWYPWGPEALTAAREQDRPILLSVGYAACHWCHVMERESFEDEAIAKLMNEHFVCIKVDREERPDVDEIYMGATVTMNGGGGWPMTVFLAPDQRPFFAGTYYPPRAMRGRPGFTELLQRIAEVWRDKREQVLSHAAQLTEELKRHNAVPTAGVLDAELVTKVVDQLEQTFDPTWGGFGNAPKFPPSTTLQVLLRNHHHTGDEQSLRMAVTTLDGMKNGGMYDHVGGGFARYATDAQWLVPHFEKMLYDNAQLARVYLEAWQVTHDPEYQRVARETLDYVLREMQSEQGGFYCATDADSEGEEGRFFVFSQTEIEDILGKDAAVLFCAYYDVSAEGNWEGKNILNTPRSIEELAKELGHEAQALRSSLGASRTLVYEARKQRVPPLLDDKVLTSWNALMIGTMAEGYRVLRDERYLKSAEAAARFLKQHLVRPDGGLLRTFRAGKAQIGAFLEDYAYLCDALVDLYEAGGQQTYLEQAERLADRILSDFDDGEGGLFHTAKDHDNLILRPREAQDSAVPSAPGVAARALLRLGQLLGREELEQAAIGVLNAHARLIEVAPRAFMTSLALVDALKRGPTQLAYVGRPGQPDTEALAAEVARHFVPYSSIAWRDPQTPPSSADLPLLTDRTLVDDKATLYVCRNFTCKAPVTDAQQVHAALVPQTEQTNTNASE